MMNAVADIRKLASGDREQPEIRTGRVTIDPGPDEIEKAGLALVQSALDRLLGLRDGDALAEKAGQASREGGYPPLLATPRLYCKCILRRSLRLSLASHPCL